MNMNALKGFSPNLFLEGTVGCGKLLFSKNKEGLFRVDRGDFYHVTPVDMAEPAEKKVKLDKLEAFRSDEGLVKQLRERAVEKLRGHSYGFRLLKIQWCNAHKGVSFSDAVVECTSNADDAYLLFDCIFQRGFEVLDAYIKNKELPTGNEVLIALELLLEFITDFTECEKALKEPSENKTDWTIRLAHHLLSKIAVNPNYVIDNQSCYQTRTCNCCNKRITGKFGDTSIGNTRVWHGYADILIGVDSVAVNVADNKSSTGNESSLEMENLKKYKRSQVLAQTIIFSLLTQKRHPEYSSFLVPSIVIKNTEAVVFFYDCESDILLQSCPLKLFTGSGELNWSTVFALWLSVNFKYFCSGTPKTVKELDFRADFYKFIEPVSEIYEDVTMGCGSGEYTDEDFYPTDLQHLRPIGRSHKDD